MTTELPLKATLKSGAGYDAPWLTVDGANPDDLAQKLASLVSSDAIPNLVEAANAFKAAPSGWGNRPQQQQTASAQQGGARLHPEGKTCQCGNVLNYKSVTRRSDNKQFNFWECPARQGKNDTVHTSEFAN